MNKKVKIGIAGCGWIAENVYLPLLSSMDNYIINALYDIEEYKLLYLGEKFKIRNLYNNLETFLKSDIDAVVIVTPNYSHKDISIAAAYNKKHILCEKPLVLNVSEYLDINKAVSDNKVIYVPGLVNRFRQDIQLMNLLIENNYIGKIKGVEVGWIRGKGIPQYGSWFTQKEKAGGGVLYDLGSHVLDICMMNMEKVSIDRTILRSIYDDAKVEGQATWYKNSGSNLHKIDVEDTAFCSVWMKEDITIQAIFSWNSNQNGDVTYFKWIGDEGELELNTLFGYSAERLHKENLLSFKSNKFDNVNILFDSGRRIQDNAFKKLLLYFKDCIQLEQVGHLSLKSACGGIELIDNLYKSEVRVENALKKNMLKRRTVEEN